MRNFGRSVLSDAPQNFSRRRNRVYVLMHLLALGAFRLGNALYTCQALAIGLNAPFGGWNFLTLISFRS